MLMSRIEFDEKGCALFISRNLSADVLISTYKSFQLTGTRLSVKNLSVVPA